MTSRIWHTCALCHSLEYPEAKVHYKHPYVAIPNSN